MLVVQALGWVAVAWLLAAHVLVERGRLARDGAGYRLAACGAAAAVVFTAVADEMWPVIALGLLWLRTEVFTDGHPEAQAATVVRRLGPRVLRGVFRLELVVIAVILLVLLREAARDAGERFDSDTDATVCRLLQDRC